MRPTPLIPIVHVRLVNTDQGPTHRVTQHLWAADDGTHYITISALRVLSNGDKLYDATTVLAANACGDITDYTELARVGSHDSEQDALHKLGYREVPA